MAVDHKISLGLKKWCGEKGFTVISEVGEVAEYLGVTKEQLQSFFHLWMKKDFRLWRKELRIAEAMDIFSKDAESSITKIGELVGIDDCSDFRKYFREVTGYYPNEWRAKFGPGGPGRSGSARREKEEAPAWRKDVSKDANGIPELPDPCGPVLRGEDPPGDGNYVKRFLSCLKLIFTPFPNRAYKFRRCRKGCIKR